MRIVFLKKTHGIITKSCLASFPPPPPLSLNPSPTPQSVLRPLFPALNKEKKKAPPYCLHYRNNYGAIFFSSP